MGLAERISHTPSYHFLSRLQPKHGLHGLCIERWHDGERWATVVGLEDDMASAVDIVSRAVREAKDRGDTELVRLINSAINHEYAPFEVIVERFNLKDEDEG